MPVTAAGEGGTTLALRFPQVPAGPILDLFDALHSLYIDAGEPPMRALGAAVHLSHTSVHTVFTKAQVPSWGLLELIVAQLADRDATEVVIACFKKLRADARREEIRLAQEQPLFPVVVDETPSHPVSTEEIRDQVTYELERDRAAAQVEAGKRANALLVAKQAEIAEKAIEVWGQLASARSDDELERWRNQDDQKSAGTE